MKVEINLNDTCYIKLTDYGRKILKEKYEEFNRDHGDIYKYNPKNEDSEGWSKWQLWDIMTVFGNVMYNGFNIPFETDIRLHTN